MISMTKAADRGGVPRVYRGMLRAILVCTLVACGGGAKKGNTTPTGAGSGSASTDQFNLMMPAIEQWMDTGVAPEVVMASRVVNGVTTRTRPLCAYPKYAHYNPPAEAAAVFGTEDAYLFSCVSP